MRVWPKTWKVAVGLYVIAQILFLIGIQFPTKVDFDEFHYVPAAKTLYQFNKIPNREHPPLAKWIIGAGIKIVGDNPPGWRIMSTIFGALTLVGMYYWGLAMFRDEKLALWLALLTLFNQLLYVQARIAMLDTFMVAFMVWGFAAFTSTWWPDLSEHQVRRRLLWAGVFFGLSTACKWYGLMALLTCVGMMVLVAIFRSWGVSFAGPAQGGGSIPLKSGDWYSPDLWKGLTLQDWFMYLGLIPAIVYFLTFLPYAFFTEGVPVWRFIAFQRDMYGDQLRVVGTHPYMSTWQDWPLISRPIWYAFDQEGTAHRCVCLLGNPLVMWGGLIALVFCAYGFVRDRSREGFLILFFYLGLFGSWLLIPRKVSFYYYYYPAAMVLSLAIAYVFFCWDRRARVETQQNQKGAKKEKNQASPRKATTPIARWVVLALALGLFIYFFPILSGQKVMGDDFRQYMWFPRWI